MSVRAILKHAGSKYQVGEVCTLPSMSKGLGALSIHKPSNEPYARVLTPFERDQILADQKKDLLVIRDVTQNLFS